MSTALPADTYAPVVDLEKPPATSTTTPQDLDVIALGLAPWRWRKRFIEHATLLSEQEADRRLASVNLHLHDIPPVQADRVQKLVRSSAVTTNCASPWTGILFNRLSLIMVFTVLAIAPMTALVLALALGPPLGIVKRILVVFIALVLPILLVALVLLMEKYPYWSVAGVVVATSLALGSANAVAMWPSGPAWLESPVFHTAMEASAWPAVAVTSILLLLVGGAALDEARVGYLNRRRNPEAFLVNALTYVVHELPHVTDARATYLEELDAGAQAIERHWSKSVAGRASRESDEMAELAHKIGAAVRARHVPVRVGTVDPVDIRGWLVVVLDALAMRDTAFFRLFDGSDDDTRSHVAMWRRLARGLLAWGLLLFAGAGLVVALWQPGLPVFLQEHGWTSLATVLTVDDVRLQAPLVAGALGLAKAFISFYGPRSRGQVEGRPKDGITSVGNRALAGMRTKR